MALALLDTNYKIQKASRQSKSQDALVERARWPRSFLLFSFPTQLTITFSETEGGVTFYLDFVDTSNISAKFLALLYKNSITVNVYVLSRQLHIFTHTFLHSKKK